MGSGTIDAGGVATYHEIHGSGPPLLLLHGGFQTIDTVSRQRDALMEHFTVHLPERRGHGRTPDVDGPVTYDAMAADTIAYMDAVGIKNADIVGYSDGAIIGLLLAQSHAGRVRRLVSVSANFSPEVIDFGVFMTAPIYQETIARMRSDYDALSPDGAEHRPVVREKLMRMWAEEPNLTVEELGEISRPVLVMAGDRDIVPIDHTIELWRAIPSAELCIIPGATHLLMDERADLVNAAILGFLS